MLEQYLGVPEETKERKRREAIEKRRKEKEVVKEELNSEDKIREVVLNDEE